MTGQDGRKPHHGVAHGHGHPQPEPRPTAARPHRHHLDDAPEETVAEVPARLHQHLPRHGRRGPLRGTGTDAAACAASNRRVLHALGSFAVAVTGDAAAVARLAAATAARLPETPVAFIGPAAPVLPGVSVAATGVVPMDAHAAGLAMDEVHLRPAGLLFIACEAESGPLGEDARLSPGAGAPDPDAGPLPEDWIHWLMAGLAARAR